MFNNVKISLTDLFGKEYIDKVIEANAFFGADAEELKKVAYEQVEFFPEKLQNEDAELINKLGESVISPFETDNLGASTDSYQKALNKNAAPISGKGCYRVGENGKLYFVGKSEHYHASLGHNFNGYKLIDNARKLGILNATHNNTRGFITRTLERELVRTANGAKECDVNALLASREKHVLNRVISLETGSLAVEAGLKMMFNRFYGLGATDSVKYAGRIPVFFVMADMSGGCEANYHGTTIIAQTFRNIWPNFYNVAEKSGLYKVVSVKINDIDDFKAKIEEYNKPPYKTAGFMHEIVLMNYAGILLKKDYLKKAYDLCHEYDTPTLCDEIQSCVWYKELFLFREYDINPDFVIIGKGFAGGEYPASKVLTTAEMDTLNQFGALVTNGQEELASLAYLITMKFVSVNGEIIEKNQNLFFEKLSATCAKNPAVKKVEGKGYLAAVIFDTVENAVAFAKKVSEKYIDISVQTYKKNCPPAMLIKLPMIVSEKEINALIEIFKASF